jgi:hypothetical protein
MLFDVGVGFGGLMENRLQLQKLKPWRQKIRVMVPKNIKCSGKCEILSPDTVDWTLQNLTLLMLSLQIFMAVL